MHTKTYFAHPSMSHYNTIYEDHRSTSLRVTPTTQIDTVVTLVYFHGFFDLPNLPSRNMALGFTQPLTEISTRNFLGVKGRPARKADNFTATYEPTV
jgi:hypothetical protein